MKIYTEEQVREMLKSTHIHTDNDVDMIIPKFTPIKLPSDEAINEEAHNYAKKYRAVLPEIAALINGAKWMRDKIQGGGE